MAYTALPVHVLRGWARCCMQCSQSGQMLLMACAIIGLRVGVQEFQPKLAKVQDFPWSVATADDAVHHISLSQF